MSFWKLSIAVLDLFLAGRGIEGHAVNFTFTVWRHLPTSITITIITTECPKECTGTGARAEASLKAITIAITSATVIITSIDEIMN